MALIVASVPELTSRTFSIDGTASIISSASSFSAKRGRAEAGAPAQGRLQGRHDGRVTVAEDHRSPGADVVEVAVAVDVEQIGPRGAVEEDRLAADAAERPGGAVHSAGHELPRPLESEMAFLTHFRTSSMKSLAVCSGRPVLSTGSASQGTGTAWFDNVRWQCLEPDWLRAVADKPERMTLADAGAHAPWYAGTPAGRSPDAAGSYDRRAALRLVDFSPQTTRNDARPARGAWS